MEDPTHFNLGFVASCVLCVGFVFQNDLITYCNADGWKWQDTGRKMSEPALKKSSTSKSSSKLQTAHVT